MKFLKEFKDIQFSEDDITIPINVDISGHIGTPIKNIRTQKLGKKNRIKQIIVPPNPPDMQQKSPSSTKVDLNYMP